MADDKKQTFKAAPPTDHTDLADTPDVTYADGDLPGNIADLDPDVIAKMKGGHVRTKGE